MAQKSKTRTPLTASFRGFEGVDLTCAERYLNNPCETAPEELLTEIYIPVE